MADLLFFIFVSWKDFFKKNDFPGSGVKGQRESNDVSDFGLFSLPGGELNPEPSFCGGIVLNI